MTPEDHAEAAEAHLAKGNFIEALAACEAGAAAVKPSVPFKRAALFRGLADRAALAAAASCGPNAEAGFQKRCLVVRPAADDGDDGTGSEPQFAAASSKQQQQIFTSLEEALDASDDGDTIVLLPGTHSVRAPGGLTIDKRVLICSPAAAALGGYSNSKAAQPTAAASASAAVSAVIIDYRGNAPFLRITRSCALRGFAVDMVGFAPAVLVEGGGSGSSSANNANAPAPLLDRVSLSCSGGDALAVGGAARPLLLDCELAGRTAGVRAYEAATLTLRGCRVTTSGGGGGTGATNAAAPAGIVLQEAASATLEACRVYDCAGEGVAASGQATARLARGTIVTNCRGPAVDASDEAFVALDDAELTGCVGGLWLWGRARAHAERSLLAPARSFAVVLDGGASATSGGANIVDGPVLAGEPGDGGMSGKLARRELLSMLSSAAEAQSGVGGSCARMLVANRAGAAGDCQPSAAAMVADHFPPNAPPFIDDGPAFLPL